MPRHGGRKSAAKRKAAAGRRQGDAAGEASNSPAAPNFSGATHTEYPFENTGLFLEKLEQENVLAQCAHSCLAAEIVRSSASSEAAAAACCYLRQERQRLADSLQVPGPCPLGDGCVERSSATPKELPSHTTAAAQALVALAALHRHVGAQSVTAHNRTFVGSVLERPIIRDGIVEVLLWDDDRSVILLRQYIGLARGAALKVRSRCVYATACACACTWRGCASSCVTAGRASNLV